MHAYNIRKYIEHACMCFFFKCQKSKYFCFVHNKFVNLKKKKKCKTSFKNTKMIEQKIATKERENVKCADCQ